ncbi:hypothetical protein AAZX31_02G181200 [Glycine max]
MGSDICIVNGLGTHEWRKGWPLRSGGFAQLLKTFHLRKFFRL